MLTQRRMCFRFSLRSLAGIIALIAIAIGWVANQRKRFEQELLISETLFRNHDATVWSVDGVDGIDAPLWNVSEILNGRLYRPVTALSIGSTELTEDVWKTVCSFGQLDYLSIEDCTCSGADFSLGPSSLRELRIARTPLTESQISGISKCRHLEILELSGTEITDGGVKHLAAISTLKDLDLRRTKVSDRALVDVSNIVLLERLYLSGTCITSHGVHELTRLRNIQCLYLDGTSIDDEVFLHLSTMRALTELNLSNTAISDRGLHYIEQLNRLRYLYLANTSITDAGVVALSHLHALSVVDLRKTMITDSSAETLLAMPSLRIELCGLDGRVAKQLRMYRALDPDDLTRKHGGDFTNGR